MNQLTDYAVYSLPITEIYIEPMFNCRESIALNSVIELADSIRRNGLQVPVVVQPRKDCEHIPSQYKYRLIVGFRRFTACVRLLKYTEIPAFIKEGLDNIPARAMNLSENIDRKELNILEEARTLGEMFPEHSMSINQVASYMKRHRNWVAVRYMLLKLPEKVQQAAAEGLLTQTEIRLIWSVTPQARLAVFDKLIASKYVASLKEKQKYQKIAPPTVRDISARLQILVNNGLGGLLAEFLIWAMGGDIDTVEIDMKLKRMLDKYEQCGFLVAEDIVGEYPKRVQ